MTTTISNNRCRRIFALLALFFVSGMLLAVKETRNTRLTGTAITGTATLQASDDKYTGLPGWNSGFSLMGSVAKVEFGINEDLHLVHGVPVCAILTFDVDLTDANLVTTSYTGLQLNIDYDPGALTKYTDKAQLTWSNYYNVVVKNMSIVMKTTGCTAIIAKTNDVYVEAEISSEKEYAFTAGLSQLTTIDYQHSFVAADNELEVHWNFMEGAEEYELEWTYVDDYLLNNPVTPKSTTLISYDLEHDATRVITTNQYYRIPLTYERGYLVYRLRPVGRSVGGERLEGAWTAISLQGTISSLSTAMAANRDCYRTSALTALSINWASTKTFNENGRQGSGVSYMDGLLKGRQSIARLNTENKSMVQGTLFDFKGRPAISMLPSPIAGKTFGYNFGLNKYDDGGTPVIFDKDIFDACGKSCDGTTFQLDSVHSGGSANYYSNSTSAANKEGLNGYTPSAHGVPYTQVRFSGDPLNRITRSTLPGLTHGLGSGHEMQFYYVDADIGRLIRLFGPEAGTANHYWKKISIDPNGQATSAYIDMYGRTVATAVMGGAPAGMDTLPDTTPPVVSVQQLDESNVSDSVSRCLISSTTFYVSTSGEEQSFFYSTVIGTFMPDKCYNTGCMDCAYDLDISIKDECGVEYFDSDNDPKTPGEELSIQIGAKPPYGTYDCKESSSKSSSGKSAFVGLTSLYTLPGTTLTITFPHPGVYTITKKLCVSEAPLASYIQEIEDNQTCISRCGIIDSLIALADFSGCGIDCEECAASMEAYQSNALKAGDPEHPPLTQSEIDEILSRCELLCPDQLSPCEKYKRAMMLDFKPGGRLGSLDPTSAAYAYSIYNPAHPVNWQHPPGPGAGSPAGVSNYYKDGSGNYASVVIYGIDYRPEELADVSDFISNYSDSWGEAFLSIHPDYCKYMFYCNQIAGSWDYDQDMMAIDNFADACAAGFVQPLTTSFTYGPVTPCTGIGNYDPLFQSPLVSTINPTDLSNFNTEMNSIGGSGNNIYLEASLSALSILGSPSSLGSHTFGSDLCFQDAEWIQFRTLYLMKKMVLYKNMYQNYIQQRNCPEVPQGFTSIFGFGIKDIATIFGLNNSGTPVTDISQITTGTTYTLTMAAQCDSNCHAYATVWAQNLSSYCPGYNSLTPTQQSKLIRDLTAICMEGCDGSHPDGSSTIATGATPYVIPGTSVSCSSFQDVVNYYLTPAGSCDVTSAVSTPLSYTATSLSTTYNLKDCGCDKILGVDYDFTGGSYTLPPGVTTGRKLFKYRYGFDLSNYNFLVCACKSALTTTWTPGHTWSGAELATLTGYNYPVHPQLSCITCTSCSDVSAAVTTVMTEVGSMGAGHDFFSAHAQAILNNLNQFGETGMDIYQVEDLYNNCMDAAVTSNHPMIVSNSLLNPIAADIEAALSQWASGGNLAESHPMTLCTDPGYFLSNLYSGDLPAIPYRYYTATIVGDQLTIQITDGTSAVLCSYVLNLPPGSGLSWGSINNISNLVGYAVAPSTGGLAYTFAVDVSDGSTTVQATGTNSCWSLFSISSSLEPMYCPQDPLVNPNQCKIDIINGAIAQGNLLYQQQLDQLIDTFTAQFLDYCFDVLDEDFSRRYSEKEYHYTLYYYDQAGDLVRTVAPKGVDAVNGTTTVFPDHADFTNPTDPMDKFYVSRFGYNSFDQPVNSQNPDGGITVYFYDRIGRIVASQNALQLGNSAYTYSLYDNLGRMSETGEISGTTPAVLTDAVTSDAALFASFVSSGIKKDVIITLYDDPLTAPAAYAQFTGGSPKNLRNRVAGSLYYKKYPSVSPQLNFATWYSYDPYGNVNEIIQQNEEVSHMTSLHYKKVQYEYELVSGNVLRVIFQPDAIDQMVHQYYYDDDNRLKEVYTSTDKVNWEKDAKYFYYQHGPMGRVEKGDKKVDASDYYYTIQGWVKGVNANNIGANTDPGKDGNNLSAYSSTITGLHAWIARDASAYSLNYYSTSTEGDYDAIKTFATGTTATNLAGDYDPIASVAALPAGTNLFNGNISGMITTLTNKGQNVTPLTQLSLPMITRYKYDQLNRLKKSSSFYSINESTNTWNTPTPSNLDNSYKTTLTYDPNGNILSFFKNGAAPTTVSGDILAMDDMTYKYEETSFSLNPMTGKNTNRLSLVNDAVPSANYNDDIDDEGSSTYNYEYNATGSLEHDPTQAIDYIEWTPDKKVRKIIRSISQLIALNKTMSDLEFEYDSHRRRVVKIEKPRDKITKVLFPQEHWVYTYYVYDAGGNMMATYKRYWQTYSGAGSYNFTDECVLMEQNLYGSKRLGVKNHVDLLPLELRDIAVSPTGTSETFMHTYSGSSFNYIQNIYNITSVNPYNPPPSPNPYVTTERELGNKQFEFTNHLGNVLTTVSDRKLPSFSGSGLDYYKADVLSTQDYYVFGQQLPGRGYVAETYRYGFNGMEKDDEVDAVEGSSLDFGARMYDARLGRFMSRDPLAEFYAAQTPYVYALNSPVACTDEGGRGPRYEAIAAEFEKDLDSYSAYGVTYQKIETAYTIMYKVTFEINGKKMIKNFSFNEKTNDYTDTYLLTSWGSDWYDAVIATSGKWTDRMYYKLSSLDAHTKTPMDGLLLDLEAWGNMFSLGELSEIKLGWSALKKLTWKKGVKGFAESLSHLFFANDASSFLMGENMTFLEKFGGMNKETLEKIQTTYDVLSFLKGMKDMIEGIVKEPGVPLETKELLKTTLEEVNILLKVAELMKPPEAKSTGEVQEASSTPSF